MEEDSSDLALLDVRQPELHQSVVRVQVVLRVQMHTQKRQLPSLPRRVKKNAGTDCAAHDDDKHPPPHIRVHSLLPRKLHQVILLSLERDRFGSSLGGGVVDERVATPCGSDEPPLALGVGGEKIRERDAEGVVCED